MIIIFGVPADFVPRIGMKIKNIDDEFWIIKSISFEQMQNNLGGNLKVVDNFIYRGFGIEPINKKGASNIFEDDYFMNDNKWELLE